MKNLMKFAFVLGLAATTSAAFAECFDVVGNPIESVGPVTLAMPAYRVCKTSVSGFAGKYYSLSFADNLGDLAQLASKTEVLGRCPGFCRVYTLLSGNSNGQNVNPDGTVVEFMVERETGTLRITHPDTGTKEYTVTPARGNLR